MRTVAILIILLLTAACGGEREAEPTRAVVPTFTATTIPPTAEPPTSTPVPVLLVPTDTPTAVVLQAVEAATVAPATPVPVATVAPPVAACDCSGDVMNCGDFASGDAAQQCFDYCMATVGFDVHQLDRDQDGLFCESR